MLGFSVTCEYLSVFKLIDRTSKALRLNQITSLSGKCSELLILSQKRLFKFLHAVYFRKGIVCECLGHFRNTLAHLVQHFHLLGDIRPVKVSPSD